MGVLRENKKLPLPLRAGAEGRGSFFLAIAFLPLALPAYACPNPRQMDGFKICANMEQTEQEGKLRLYGTDPESATEQVLAQLT